MTASDARQRTKGIASLSDSLLFEVFEYVSLADRRRTLETCRALWKQRIVLENNVKCLQIRSRNEMHGGLMSTYRLLVSRYGPVLTNLCKLVHLDIGSLATDNLLYLLPTSACCNSLESISMIGSLKVSDTGLMLLARRRPMVTDIHCLGTYDAFQGSKAATMEGPPHRSSPLSSLKLIDLTFCRRTTYSGTFWLRDGLPNLKCIRRIPNWLEGRFYTPFGPGGEVELHSYWPDGTFCFARDVQSHGFVMDLFPWDKELEDEFNDDNATDYDFKAVDFVGDKLQYNDVSFDRRVPEEVEYAYRPGVSLLRLPPEREMDSESSSVLVSQFLNGLKPPSSRDWMEQALLSGIQPGHSKYYTIRNRAERIGQEAQYRANEDVELIETQSDVAFARERRGPRPLVMITRMKFEPLSSRTTAPSANTQDMESLLPPESLIEKCRATCQRLERFRADDLETVEHDLDVMLRHQVQN